MNIMLKRINDYCAKLDALMMLINLLSKACEDNSAEPEYKLECVSYALEIVQDYGTHCLKEISKIIT